VSEPLFQDIPDPKLNTMPVLRRSDIESAHSSDLLNSPTNVLAAAAAASATGPTSARDLSSMPDPNGRYAALCVQFPYLKTTKVAAPDVRDVNGRLIHPSEYQTPHHLKPVFIEVYLRVWEISPRSADKRANSGSYTNNVNGSRVYQLVLKRMELLPSNIPANNLIDLDSSPNIKGKQRASNDQTYDTDSDHDAGPSTTK